MRLIKTFLVFVVIIFSLITVAFVADKFYKQKIQKDSLIWKIKEEVVLFGSFDLNYCEQNKNIAFATQLKRMIDSSLLLDSIKKLSFVVFEEKEKLSNVLIIEISQEETILNSLSNWQAVSFQDNIYSNGLFFAQKVDEYLFLSSNLEALNYFASHLYLSKNDNNNSLKNSVNYNLVMRNFLQKESFLSFYFDWSKSSRFQSSNSSTENNPLLLNLAHVFQGVIQQGAVTFFPEDNKLKVKYFNLSNSLDISRLIENVFDNQQKSDIFNIVPANIDFLYQSYNLAAEFANLKNFIRLKSESDFVFLNSFLQNLKEKYSIDLEKIVASIKYDYAFIKKDQEYAIIFKVLSEKENIETQLIEIKKSLTDILAVKYPKIEEVSLEDGTQVKQLVVNDTAWHEIEKDVNGVKVKELTLLENNEDKYYTAFISNYFVFTKGFDLIQQIVTDNELKLTDSTLKENLPAIGINLMEVFYISLKKIDLKNIYFANWWQELLAEYDYFVFGKNVYNEGSSGIGVFY